MDESSARKPRALIVEDEALVALDLKATLTRMGIDVCAVAADAAEALAEAERLRPDFVMMDVNLGQGGDGVDVAQELRRRFGIPSIFMTAYVDPSTVDRAMAAQPLGFLGKPETPSAIVDTVNAALRRLD